MLLLHLPQLHTATGLQTPQNQNIDTTESRKHAYSEWNIKLAYSRDVHSVCFLCYSTPLDTAAAAAFVSAISSKCSPKHVNIIVTGVNIATYTNLTLCHVHSWFLVQQWKKKLSLLSTNAVMTAPVTSCINTERLLMVVLMDSGRGNTHPLSGPCCVSPPATAVCTDSRSGSSTAGTGQSLLHKHSTGDTETETCLLESVKSAADKNRNR